jgi:hypothetical protein
VKETTIQINKELHPKWSAIDLAWAVASSEEIWLSGSACVSTHPRGLRSLRRKLSFSNLLSDGDICTGRQRMKRLLKHLSHWPITNPDSWRVAHHTHMQTSVIRQCVAILRRKTAVFNIFEGKATVLGIGHFMLCGILLFGPNTS